MTHNSIEVLIDLLNTPGPHSRARERIFIGPITNEVDFAHDQ